MFGVLAAEDVVWLVFLEHRLAAGAAGSRLALGHYAGGSVRPPRPSHRLRGYGPAGRPADGRGQPGPKVCPEHAARQSAVLRPVSKRSPPSPHLFTSCINNQHELLLTVYCAFDSLTTT